CHRLNDYVVGRAVPHGTGLSETGNARVDKAIIAREQRLSPDAEPVGHTGPEILDDHIGVIHQLAGKLQVARLFQIKRDTLFSTVSECEKGALAIHKGADMAIIIPMRRLDLDDPRAKIGQERRAKRTG